MQVNLTTNPGATVRGVEQSLAARPVERPVDQAEFSQFEAINHALDSEPEVRAREVERAKDLFTSVQYPPVQLIHRISRLLARQWGDVSE
jgi:hypothetical protein